MSSPALYRSARTAATAATVLLAVTGAAALFSFYTDVRMFAAADDILTHSVLSGDAFGDADRLARAASTIHLVAQAGSVVAFLAWFHQVRVNAEFLAPHGHRYRRMWALVGWFVPVANFWLPRQITGDIWQAGARPDGLGVREPLPQALLNSWWVTFLGADLLGWLGSRSDEQAFYADAYRESALWLGASDLLEPVAAVFAVLLVRRLTATQERRLAELPAGPVSGVHVSTVEG
ncbi:DUF4328 domain-containing protein [Streptomyces sp. CBMA123]|uniref:DUF4328 domain-containing protein n=1 Tax=Streptomyces sp. CBMA123 TaxID=1896313 RepID=UPI0016618C7C|nr:DUF4328 domain-containing protein [Streptomyces sp. CBMA123]MBD0694701.1 hypothetical protein [Streptomyces sp. CBMA123]